MKKLLLLLIILLSVMGCASKEPESETAEIEQVETVGLANPWKDATSKEELNELIGSNLSKPGMMGIEELSFSYVENSDFTLVQYVFTLNSVEFTERCAVTEEDISGIYGTDGLIFSATENTDGVIDYVKEGETLSARWFVEDYQYNLTCSNPELSYESFKNIAEEIATLSGLELHPYTDLLGSYYDETSQRATLEISPNTDNDLIHVVVYWPISATEMVEWIMDAEVIEEKLVYSNLKKESITFENENDDGTITELDASKEGYFTITEGKLLWDGASEEDVKNCLFSKGE